MIEGRKPVEVNRKEKAEEVEGFELHFEEANSE